MSKVLLCLDGSGFAEQVIPHALAQCHGCGDELVLLRVAEPFRLYIDGSGKVRLEQAALAEARRYLDEMGSRLRAPGRHVTTQLRHGSPSHEIGVATRELQPDLVMVGSHGRSGLNRWLLGSVAENVARFSCCPVWLVRCLPGRALSLEPQPEPAVVLLALDGTGCRALGYRQRRRAGVPPCHLPRGAGADPADRALHLTVLAGMQ